MLSLIYEEFCLSEEYGDAPDVESFCVSAPARFAGLTAQVPPPVQPGGWGSAAQLLPDEGECFEEFQRVSLLGSGGTSRVFLARDLSLGGKQVVLKVSLDRGQEPKAQGPLDHPHIVAVNSVTFQPEKLLRGLSMPYRLGLALDEIISG